MTPDAWTNLQIINCSPLAIYSGSGGPPQGFYNQYQMSSWFNWDSFKDATLPVVPVTGTSQYLLQFERGVGDQDDAADIQLNVGPSNTAEANVVWVQARTASNSAHYIQAQLQTPSIANVGPFAIAITARGLWPTNGPNGLSWYCGNQIIQLGAPDDAQCLAIIDLQALFGAQAAQVFASMLSVRQPSPEDALTLWLAVNHYMAHHGSNAS